MPCAREIHNAGAVANATALKKQADAAGKELSNVFLFCREVFGDGQELLFYERQKEIIRQLEEFDL